MQAFQSIRISPERRCYRAQCGPIAALGETPERAREALIQLALRIASYQRTVIAFSDHRRIEIYADARGYASEERLADGSLGRAQFGPSEDEAWRFAAYLINREEKAIVVGVWPTAARERVGRYVEARLPTAVERSIHDVETPSTTGQNDDGFLL